MARRRLGSCIAVASNTLSLLRARGQVEFSLPRLRAGAPGPAFVCHPALSKLVSASDPETGKLEGAELCGRIVIQTGQPAAVPRRNKVPRALRIGLSSGPY